MGAIVTDLLYFAISIALVVRGRPGPVSQRAGVPARRLRRPGRRRPGRQPPAGRRVLPAQPGLRRADRAVLGPGRRARPGAGAADRQLGVLLLVLGALHVTARRSSPGCGAGARDRGGRAGRAEPGPPRRAAPAALGQCRTLTDVAAELTPRAQQTRAAIVQAALALFRERGYDATTMRDIAARAGVSTGNAYYYFGSKEELVQEYYVLAHAEHLAASAAALAGEADLGARLRATVRALIDVSAPYHAFAATFLPQVRGGAEQPAQPVQQGVQPDAGTRRSRSTARWWTARRPGSAAPSARAAAEAAAGGTPWAWSCTGCTTRRRGARGPGTCIDVTAPVGAAPGWSRPPGSRCCARR